MTRDQIALATKLWREGKDTFDIASALQMHQSSVANELAVIRGREPRPEAPTSVRVAAPPVYVPAWVAPQFRREYVRLTLAVGEDRAACAARMHLRQTTA